MTGERAGMPPVIAQATHQLARVLARRTRAGDRDEAAALATGAAALADRLGMRPLQRQAQDLAAPTRSSPATPPGPRWPPRSVQAQRSSL